jgi:hypothetical protein
MEILAAYTDRSNEIEEQRHRQGRAPRDTPSMRWRFLADTRAYSQAATRTSLRKATVTSLIASERAAIL